jgi:hypothetical protein
MGGRGKAVMDDTTAVTPAPEIKQLKKRLDLSSFPSEWRLTAVSIACTTAQVSDRLRSCCQRRIGHGLRRGIGE